MKNLRKDAVTGIALLIAWLAIKFLFRGSGVLLWILGAAGLVITIVGLLPESLHAPVIRLKDKLLGVFKK